MPSFAVPLQSRVQLGSWFSGRLRANQESAMGELPLRTQQSEDRMDSWKGIAAYLKRDAKTVKRSRSRGVKR
jgi:hypothetical protein